MSDWKERYLVRMGPETGGNQLPPAMRAELDAVYAAAGTAPWKNLGVIRALREKVGVIWARWDAVLAADDRYRALVRRP